MTITLRMARATRSSMRVKAEGEGDGMRDES
jgi:hypothetical protein